ncbi:hypothetical protein [Methylobacterium sp. PvR107]|uniref:hypothetical protein n=1 Tax=Methylobacterium sp. PvR107 TaxID=2806597 RepID=UPI001B72481E|nr:hypothetical protein [Methylobacterium sp. PvR107]MBP1182515.1 hypothetical protein [Methylobacterium sp. PvR107]
MRLLIGLVLAAILFYGLALVVLGLNQRRVLYPGADRSPRAGVAVPDAAAIALVTEDGETLHALWKSSQPGCGVVVSFHGHGSRPEPQGARFSDGAWHLASGASWPPPIAAIRARPGNRARRG